MEFTVKSAPVPDLGFRSDLESIISACLYCTRSSVLPHALTMYMIHISSTRTDPMMIGAPVCQPLSMVQSAAAGIHLSSESSSSMQDLAMLVWIMLAWTCSCWHDLEGGGMHVGPCWVGHAGIDGRPAGRTTMRAYTFEASVAIYGATRV